MEKDGSSQNLFRFSIIPCLFLFVGSDVEQGGREEMLDKCLRGNALPKQIAFLSIIEMHLKITSPKNKPIPSLPPPPKKKPPFHHKDAKNAKVFFSSLCFFLTFSIFFFLAPFCRDWVSVSAYCFKSAFSTFKSVFFFP